MHPERANAEYEAALEKIDAVAASGIALTTKEGQPRSQASILTDLGRQHHLFHDEGGDAYARVRVKGHAEVYAINSTAYRDILCGLFYKLTGKGAGRNGVGDAISTLIAIAKHDGPQEPVYLRTGWHGDSIVIDLGDADWQCVVVTSHGWTIEDRHVVNFLRSGKATALPTPKAADFDAIWKYINVEKHDRSLIAGWLLSALCPSGPYPILLLIGEQGTGKSSSSRTCKLLTDPSAVLLRSPPREEKDLLVSALSSWVLALDNLSGAKPELSDALCRISTGGGLAGRTLYTNAEETLLEVKRPVILNGIDDLASRPDLAQRCLHIELPPLTTRATEAGFAQTFKNEAGSIFAALLSGLVLALRDRHIPRGPLPRMADFAQWAAAGIPALGFTAEQFLDAYRENQAGAIEAGLETSALAGVLKDFITLRGQWKGTARELLSELSGAAGDSDRNMPSWPRSPKGLQNSLRRLAPSLRHIGITIGRDRDAANQYVTLTCKVAGQVPQVPSAINADGGMAVMAVDCTTCTPPARRNRGSL